MESILPPSVTSKKKLLKQNRLLQQQLSDKTAEIKDIKKALALQGDQLVAQNEALAAQKAELARQNEIIAQLRQQLNDALNQAYGRKSEQQDKSSEHSSLFDEAGIARYPDDAEDTTQADSSHEDTQVGYLPT